MPRDFLGPLACRLHGISGAEGSCYKDTHEKDPQFIETAIRVLLAVPRVWLWRLQGTSRLRDAGMIISSRAPEWFQCPFKGFKRRSRMALARMLSTLLASGGSAKVAENCYYCGWYQSHQAQPLQDATLATCDGAYSRASCSAQATGSSSSMMLASILAKSTPGLGPGSPTSQSMPHRTLRQKSCRTKCRKTADIFELQV